MTPVAEGVRALLERLDRLSRREALDLVRRSLPAETVRTTLQGAGIQPVAPVKEWFAAWDGQDPSGSLGSMDVLPGFYGLSLEDALRHRIAQEWPSGWLPLQADGGGDFYVADISDSGVPVLRHRYDRSEAETTAPSLEAFLDLAVRAFDEGIIFVDKFYLEPDEAAWRNLLGLGG